MKRDIQNPKKQVRAEPRNAAHLAATIRLEQIHLRRLLEAAK